jgi:HSP20 family protein
MAKRSSKESARRGKRGAEPAPRAEKQSATEKAGGAEKRAAGEKLPVVSRRGAQWAAPVLPASPLSLVRRFAEEMDRFFGDFRIDTSPWLDFPFRAGGPGQTAWAPRVDVVEQGGKFVIRADLPGLTKKDVKVEVSDDAISIRGERRQERETKGKGFYHSERSYGSFFRAIPLPEGVAADQATATFRNGVLEVSMPAPPRPAKARPLAIEE